MEAAEEEEDVLLSYSVEGDVGGAEEGGEASFFSLESCFRR